MSGSNANGAPGPDLPPWIDPATGQAWGAVYSDQPALDDAPPQPSARQGDAEASSTERSAGDPAAVDSTPPAAPPPSPADQASPRAETPLAPPSAFAGDQVDELDVFREQCEALVLLWRNGE